MLLALGKSPVPTAHFALTLDLSEVHRTHFLHFTNKEEDELGVQAASGWLHCGIEEPQVSPDLSPDTCPLPSFGWNVKLLLQPLQLPHSAHQTLKGDCLIKGRHGAFSS